MGVKKEGVLTEAGSIIRTLMVHYGKSYLSVLPLCNAMKLNAQGECSMSMIVIKVPIMPA